MPKYVITGLEKVRDVIEAPDKEAGEKLFRAKYPAVFELLDIEESIIINGKPGYPQYVMIEDDSQDDNRHSALQLQWGCHTKIIDGKLYVDFPEMPHLDNKPLIEVSAEVWRKDNEGYL